MRVSLLGKIGNAGPILLLSKKYTLFHAENQQTISVAFYRSKKYFWSPSPVCCFAYSKAKILWHVLICHSVLIIWHLPGMVCIINPTGSTEKASAQRVMKRPVVASVSIVALFIVFSSCVEKKVSFSQEVFPLLKKRCASCHYHGNEFNQSQLIMDSYASLMQGGVHGSPIVPGHADSSLIIKKLGSNPPFGKQMPLMSKERLSDEEVSMIAKWIDQGANNN
jgi:uncharacterized membrane protein